MNHIKVTVVTVCYNAERDIEKTILSVINQTYDNIEYIIVDGASKDGTMQVVEKYKDKIAKIVSEPDKGIYDAMNKGIKLATGEWINFMNVGDCFANSNVLENFIPQISSGTDVAYGDAWLIYPVGKKYYKGEDSSVLKNRMAFCHQTAFISSKLHKEYPFNLHYKLSADFDFLHNRYMEDRVFQYIPQCIVNYDDSVGASIKNRIRGREEDAEIRGVASTLKWKIGFSIWKVKYYLKEFVKKCLPSVWVYKIKANK